MNFVLLYPTQQVFSWYFHVPSAMWTEKNPALTSLVNSSEKGLFLFCGLHVLRGLQQELTVWLQAYRDTTA